MGLNWDRFDNAVSELWKFFAPALLNFVLVVILFLPVISSITGVLLNFIYGFLNKTSTFGNFKEIFARLEIDNIPELLDAIYNSISSITLLAIVIFLVFIFLLDVFTKWVGHQIPFSIDVDREKIMINSPAASIFEEGHSADAMATAWRYARHSLDAREALTFYKEKRKTADDTISQTVANFTYDKAYVTFSVLGIIISLYFEAVAYIFLYFMLVIVFTYLAGRKIVSIRDDYARSIYTDMEIFFYLSTDEEKKNLCMINKPRLQWNILDGNHPPEDTVGLNRPLKNSSAAPPVPELTDFSASLVELRKSECGWLGLSRRKTSIKIFLQQPVKKLSKRYREYPVTIKLDNSRLLSILIKKIYTMVSRDRNT